MINAYQPFIEHNGYSDPPTFDDFLDFCDRAACAPDAPHMLRWTASEFSARYNHWSARKNCTPAVAALMLSVRWPTADA